MLRSARVIIDDMFQDLVREADADPEARTWNQAQTFFEFRSALQILQTTCTDVRLHYEINKRLIEQDEDKRRRGKKTRRQPISRLFKKWTECLEVVDGYFRTIKIEFY